MRFRGNPVSGIRPWALMVHVAQNGLPEPYKIDSSSTTRTKRPGFSKIQKTMSKWGASCADLEISRQNPSLRTIGHFSNQFVNFFLIAADSVRFSISGLPRIFAGRALPPD